MLSTKLLRSELIEDIFGYWPDFHDAEILIMVLDRFGPTLSTRILLGQWSESQQVKSWKEFDVSMRFYEVDSLELSEFNHQNVISSLTLSVITEERLSKIATEERIKVEIDSVFGLRGSFTCSGGEVTSIEETALRTGHPFEPHSNATR